MNPRTRAALDLVGCAARSAGELTLRLQEAERALHIDEPMQGLGVIVSLGATCTEIDACIEAATMLLKNVRDME